MVSQMHIRGTSVITLSLGHCRVDPSGHSLTVFEVLGHTANLFAWLPDHGLGLTINLIRSWRLAFSRLPNMVFKAMAEYRGRNTTIDCAAASDRSCEGVRYELIVCLTIWLNMPRLTALSHVW